MKLWLDHIGKSHWLVERDEVYVYNNGRICAKHFSDEAFNSTLKTKLIKFALPIDLRNNSQNASETPDPSIRNTTLYSLLTGVDLTGLVSARRILQPGLDNCPPPSMPDCSLDNPEPVCIDQRTPKTKEIQRLRCANSKLKKKLFKTERCLRRDLHEELKDRLTKRQYEFVMSQLRTGKVHPKGRRWTCKEKAFALNIFYRSSATYNALRKTCGLSLPCRNTLKKSIGNVAKDDGICPTLLEALKLKTQEMKDDEKICTLIFDEMSLKNRLAYNGGLDKVDGFESSGTGKLAGQALVFMIRGVTKNWKQVIILTLSFNRIFL